jgi:hypothetical protein
VDASGERWLARQTDITHEIDIVVSTDGERVATMVDRRRAAGPDRARQ